MLCKRKRNTVPLEVQNLECDLKKWQEINFIMQQWKATQLQCSAVRKTYKKFYFVHSRSWCKINVTLNFLPKLYRELKYWGTYRAELKEFKKNPEAPIPPPNLNVNNDLDMKKFER